MPKVRVREDIAVGTSIRTDCGEVYFNAYKASLRGRTLHMHHMEHPEDFYSYTGWYFHKDWLIFLDEASSITDDKEIEESDY